MLCGIGFTMSLFIAGLAFDAESARLADVSRLGILVGSTLSAIMGYILLARAPR
nr:Na+/H+ antiporter NhaA [Chitinimonas koreensis]